MSNIDRRDRISARRRTLEQRLALTRSPALAATVAALREPMLATVQLRALSQRVSSQGFPDSAMGRRPGA